MRRRTVDQGANPARITELGQVKLKAFREHDCHRIDHGEFDMSCSLCIDGSCTGRCDDEDKEKKKKKREKKHKKKDKKKGSKKAKKKKSKKKKGKKKSH